MAQLIAFVGYHNSGKTTVIKNVFKKLMEKGYSVGIIKSTKHSICRDHKEGSDTWTYANQGAEQLTLICPDGIVHFRPRDELNLLYMAFSMFQGVDLVLCEGFKNIDGIKKIEVARKEISTRLLKDELPGIMAVISDFDVDGCPHFKLDDFEAISQFIIEKCRLEQIRNSDEIELFVNGNKIPLKRFVRDSLKNTVCGYVSALKFTENAREIELKIRLND